MSTHHKPGGAPMALDAEKAVIGSILISGVVPPGLTRDMLTRMGLPPDEARTLFGKWVREMGTPFITAYNVPFDRAMLDRGRYAEGLRWCTCIQKASRDYLGVSLRLGGVAERFGVAVAEPAHRALSDARTAARVMVALRRAEKPVSEEGL